MKFRFILAAFALLAGGVETGIAQTTTWTGGNGTWANSGNWSNGVPVAADTAIFDSSVTTIVDAAYTFTNLEFTGGVEVFNSSSGSLSASIGIFYTGGPSVALNVPIVGTGNLWLNGGTGTLTESPGSANANIYSGSTEVYAGGTLADGAPYSFSANSILYVGGSPHGTVDVNYYETVAALGDVAGGQGYINLSPSTTLYLNSGYTSTYSGIIQGSGNLEKDGSSTQILSGANTYTGSTTIGSGATLQLGDGTNVGSLATSVVTGSGGLSFDEPSASNTTISAPITGTLGVASNGPGTAKLSGTNTYSGATTINSGTLQAGSTSAFGNSTQTLVINSSGELDLNGFSNAINAIQSLSTSSTLALNGAATLTLSDVGANASTTFAGVISGTGSLNTHEYQFSVTGNSNTYSGGTTITSGTLIANNTNPLDSATGTGPITIASGGALLLGQANTNGYINSGSAITDNGALQFFRTDVSANVIANNISGTGQVEQSGSGITELSGTNTYSGVTTVFNGTLEAGSTSAFGGASGKSQIDFTYQGTLALNGFNNTVGSITGTATSGGINLGGNTLTINDTTSNTTFAPVISGTGGSLIFGGQSMILTGSNTYTGSTDITTGLILVANTTGYGLGTGPITIGAPGTLQIGANSTAGAINPTSAVTDNGILAFSLTNSVSFPNLVSGTGGVNLLASGMITLTNANTYSGATQIEAGRLLAENPSGSATGTGNISIYSGATLEIGNADTNGAVSAASILDNGTLEFSRTDNITVGSNITGAGGILVQEFGSTVTLSGSNSYSGTTLINSGVLADQATGTFAPGSSVQIASGGSLAVGYNETVGDLENGTGAGTVTLAPGATLTIGTGNAALPSFTGIISGPGGIVINTGENSQGFGGASTYSGGTTISSGEIFISSSTVGVPGSVTSGPIGTNTLTFAGNGELSSYGLGANITLANAINLNSYNLDNDDANTNSLTLSGLISGAGGSITWCTNNILALTNANTFTGNVDMREGTLLLGSNTSAGIGGTIILDTGTTLSADGTGMMLTVANPINITGSSTQFGNNDNNNITLSGVITGSTGSVTYAGGPTGHLTINGADTYSLDGDFTIASGTVNAGSNTALGSGSTVALTGGAGLNVMSGVTIGNPLTFTGSANGLSGDGTISSAVIAGSSTVINPSGSNGNGPGILTFSSASTNGLTLASGSAIHFDLYDANGAAGTGYGLISDTSLGGLAITATPSSITFNIVTTDISGNAANALNFNPANPYSWTFATSTNPITGFNSADFNIITSGFTNNFAGGGFSITEVGNNLDLNFTPVPEPSTWALMGLGAAGLGLLAWRRRRLSTA